jgi:hypothetical protein
MNYKVHCYDNSGFLFSKNDKGTNLEAAQALVGLATQVKGSTVKKVINEKEKVCIFEVHTSPTEYKGGIK